MKNKFTIIIPHFKNVQGLHKLISTIPNSDDYKIVIVDDASPNAKKELASFEERCVVHYCDENVSAGACRNIGLSYANSDWIIFSDSDDYFTPTAFDVFMRNACSEEDVVFFKAESIELETNKKSDRSLSINNLVEKFLNTGCESIRYSSAVPWAKMIKRDLIVLNKIQFDEVMCSNDMFFSLKVGHLAKKIKASSEVVYTVTRRVGSLSTVTNIKYLNCRLNVLMETNAYLNSTGKKEYQASLLKIIISYRKVLDLKTLSDLFKKAIQGELIVIPKNVMNKNIIKKFRNVYNNVQ